jgi:hypothetical protein
VVVLRGGRPARRLGELGLGGGSGPLPYILLAAAAGLFAIGRTWYLHHHHSLAVAMNDIRRAVIDFVEAGIVVTLIALLIIFLVFFVQDAPKQLGKAEERIAELGGAPDPPIAIPPALRGTNDRRIASAVGELSDIVNTDMQRVCDEAKVALICINQIRIAQPSDCASKTNTAFTDGRTILKRLWASADTGFLVAGDPELLGVLRQAIQDRERLQIFVNFDQYARGSYEEMRFLSLIADSPEERHRLFEAALSLSDSRNRWSEATEQYCKFIKKTNERISQIRDQLAR